MLIDIGKITSIDGQFTEEEITKAYATGFKRLRAYKKVTLKQVAEETEIPFQTIARYENGINTPTITQAIKLACYYEMSLEDIFMSGIVDEEKAEELIEEHYKYLEEQKRLHDKITKNNNN